MNNCPNNSLKNKKITNHEVIIDVDYQIDEAIEFDISLITQIVKESINKSVMIELMIVQDEQIKELNKEHRGIDKATDVLSFPTDFPEISFNRFAPIGAIVISIDFIERYASEYGHTLEDEFILLFIHGYLHLCGYDHENDKGEHRATENGIIKKFNLPDSLIVRNS
jgi:probable rRNA maturation factor